MRHLLTANARALFLAGAITASVSAPAFADDPIIASFDGTFEDATFALESAIVGKGLVIDYVSHTGEMLARTASDVGSEVELFAAADIFLFCSAAVSRAVMEADPMNIQHCPYAIFVAEREGEVMIGYRPYPAGAMQQVQALLEEIVQDALE